MADRRSDFADLAERFSRLGRSDRKAVLASFSAQERETLKNALAAEQEARETEEERQRKADRQFHGYSPWLADILEAAVDGKETSLAPETAKTLVAEHQTITAAQGHQTPGGWAGVVAWLSSLASPQEDKSK